MSKADKHTRRDFLQGRAAVRLAAAKTQAWIDSTSELLGASLMNGPVAHVHASRRAMACEFSVQYHEADDDLHEEVLAALDVIESVEDRLTMYREHSEVIHINQTAADSPVELDMDLFELLQLCQHLNRETNGAFDITSGPLSRTWGFLQRAGRMPEPNEISQSLALAGGEQVLLDADSRAIRFSQPGVEINFNSIGKGYALDHAAAYLESTGQNDYLWHGGGSSVLARGVNRNGREKYWTIGLRHPLQPERRLAEFHLRDRALASAGGATQYFEHDGRRFSHIIDPRSGWPAEGVFTATALAPSAALADGLATAFFVMGVEATQNYCARHAEISAVLVCPSSEQSGFAIHAFGMQQNDWTPAAGSADC